MRNWRSLRSTTAAPAGTLPAGGVVVRHGRGRALSGVVRPERNAPYVLCPERVPTWHRRRPSRRSMPAPCRRRCATSGRSGCQPMPFGCPWPQPRRPVRRGFWAGRRFVAGARDALRPANWPCWRNGRLVAARLAGPLRVRAVVAGARMAACAQSFRPDSRSRLVAPALAALGAGRRGRPAVSGAPERACAGELVPANPAVIRAPLDGTLGLLRASERYSQGRRGLVRV